MGLHPSLFEVFTKDHFQPNLTGSELDRSQKELNGELELLQCPHRALDPGGLHGEEEDGAEEKELDLGLLLLPRLNGVEEPHGVEQPHRHVAPLLLLTVHLQKIY